MHEDNDDVAASNNNDDDFQVGLSCWCLIVESSGNLSSGRHTSNTDMTGH